jgi:hypothetical protein
MIRTLISTVRKRKRRVVPTIHLSPPIYPKPVKIEESFIAQLCCSVKPRSYAADRHYRPANSQGAQRVVLDLQRQIRLECPMSESHRAMSRRQFRSLSAAIWNLKLVHVGDSGEAFGESPRARAAQREIGTKSAT